MDSRGDERKKQGILDEAKASSPVIDKLFQEGYQFSFFQAVYLLERLYQDAARPGEEGPLSEEVVRFQPSQKRSFPAAEIRRIERKSNEHTRNITQRSEIVQMVLSFMGLYGVDSPLPAYFSEMIATLGEDEEDDSNEAEDGIRALRQFLDIFNHRLYSLFYRSWKKYRYYLQFESEARDEFSQYMLSLIGLGTSALKDLLGVEDSRLIGYVGLIGQRKRCAEGLRELLSDYFGGIDARIIEFMPRWVFIPQQYRARLITKDGIRARLGENVTIGQRICDFNGKFRIILGPLNLEKFRGFLPEGTDSRKLYRLVRFYAPDQLSFEVELLLKKAEVPALQLRGETSPHPAPDFERTNLAQLGWTSWLGRPREDPVSIVFSFQQAGSGL